jgi:FixJ family two-component response regulator
MHAYVHIVDDDASFRTALERRLKLAGYRVATYASARELLDQLPDDEETGCILLDVRIPGMSGPELQRRLNELGSTLPIVFLTGYADTATTVQAIKAGAEDFLTKPIASEQLIEAINRAVARHELARGQRTRLDSLRALLAKLTPRERQVFDLIVCGRINKQIAPSLARPNARSRRIVTRSWIKCRCSHLPSWFRSRSSSARARPGAKSRLDLPGSSALLSHGTI